MPGMDEDDPPAPPLPDRLAPPPAPATTMASAWAGVTGVGVDLLKTPENPPPPPPPLIPDPPLGWPPVAAPDTTPADPGAPATTVS